MNQKASSPVIVLFRQDLRLNDNPALTYACHTGCPIIPLYILDDSQAGKWKIGGASRWWLHHSLLSLDNSLREKGSQLYLYKGKTADILSRLIQKYNVSALFFNRCYEPYAIQLEQQLQKLIHSEGYNGSLLFEPWEIVNKQNQPFKVFTPFWNRCLDVQSIDASFPEPKGFVTKKIESATLDSLQLLPRHSDWTKKLQPYWQIGEKAAYLKLEKFLSQSLEDYDHDRDFPSLNTTSSLSPHLHFGEISPRQIFNKAKNHLKSDKFLSEIGWREFSYYQLYHFPELPEKPWKKEFENFPWDKNLELLERWQKGETGYPIVDAGMRQLWTTGWMHNRVRMICASFLIKDLFLPWQLGAEWFWDTLVDADLANNSASWQWVAGSGFDAAPFFRIFNPILQSKKFDPEGSYIKKWVPELANAPKAVVHEPWKFDFTHSYPSPIVNHEQSRKKALDAFKRIKRKIL